MKTWSFIIDKLSDKQSLILLVVIDNQGSSPGRTGFKMVVSGDGDLLGSIGGGTMEKEMVDLAREMIVTGDDKIRIKTEEHNTENLDDGANQITSGSQTIGFLPIAKSMQDEINSILGAIEDNQAGLIEYSNSGIKFLNEKQEGEKYQNEIISSNKWELTEQLGNQDQLYIFGAGHVSLALCRVCSNLDFNIRLFDNRRDLSTFKANTYANSKHIIDYRDISGLVQDGKNTYAVIISHTHESDELILEQLINKQLNYLGLMGSRKKTLKIKSNLLAKGYKEKQFSYICAPIGIPVNSRTPEEIAISIAAEIIRVRNS